VTLVIAVVGPRTGKSLRMG